LPSIIPHELYKADILTYRTLAYREETTGDAPARTRQGRQLNRKRNTSAPQNPLAFSAPEGESKMSNDYHGRYELEKEHHRLTRKQLKETEARLTAAEELLDELTGAQLNARLTISFNFLENGDLAMNFAGQSGGDDPLSQVSEGLAAIRNHLEEMANQGADIARKREHGEGWMN